MSTKLDWVYQDRTGEYRADYKGLVIRAVHDDSPENPFEAWDGHFPMLVYHDRTIDEYDKMGGVALGAVMGRFTAEQLVHDQKALRDLLNVTDDTLTGPLDCDFDEVPKWITDADVLRDAFVDAVYDLEGTDRLDKLAELHKLLGYAVHREQSTGYSQGDWAELLIVATPEAIKEFGCDSAPDYLAQQLEGQAKLYGAWAWGDVYGYVVEKPVPAPAVNDESGCCVECGRDNTGHDGEPCLYEGGAGDDCPMYEDGANVEFEELDSCWGYYGDDFAESGLEEAAIDAAEHHLTKEKADAAV